MLLLGLNDRIWKYRYPSWFTGKLSDFTGLVVFPLFLWAIVELYCCVRSKKHPPMSGLNGIVVFSGVLFTAIKVSDTAGTLYVNLASWLLRTLHDLSAYWGAAWLFSQRAQHVVDPTDLIALPALFVARWIGARHYRTPAAEPAKVRAME